MRGNLLETLGNLNEVVRVNDNGLDRQIYVNLQQKVERAIDILAASILRTEACIELDMEEMW